jgi:hypothetical protein
MQKPFVEEVGTKKYLKALSNCARLGKDFAEIFHGIVCDDDNEYNETRFAFNSHYVNAKLELFRDMFNRIKLHIVYERDLKLIQKDIREERLAQEAAHQKS